MNNEYVVSGYCVQKIMVGFQKQSYDVILKSDKDTLSVTVEKCPHWKNNKLEC